MNESELACQLRVEVLIWKQWKHTKVLHRAVPVDIANHGVCESCGNVS